MDQARPTPWYYEALPPVVWALLDGLEMDVKLINEGDHLVDERE